MGDHFPDDIGGFIWSRYQGRLFSRVNVVCQGRSCFTTTEGYIGLAPADTRARDVICVLLGSGVPMVLRLSEEDKFSIIGECYCHGIMDGAALLGPLPEGFEFVNNFVQERGGHYPEYMNRSNGKT